LAKDENISASTQNQAVNALLYLYRNVLQKDLAIPIHALRAKPDQHLPTVFFEGGNSTYTLRDTRVASVNGEASLRLWLRLMECMCLRVKDIDFEQSQIIIRYHLDDKFAVWQMHQPITWLVVKGCKGHLPEHVHLQLLGQLQGILPPNAQAILLGDGEFDDIELQAALGDRKQTKEL
jgi:hypothetical protein